MRKSLGLLLGTLLALGVAGTAGAKTLNWHGTLELDLGALPSAVIQGTGVATVNDAANNHLSTLRLAGGISGTDVVPVTDPDTTPQIPTIIISQVLLGTGTLTGLAGNLPVPGGGSGGGILPVKGVAKVCILQGCDFSLFLDTTLTLNNGITGVGVANQLTLGYVNPAAKISINNAPWTLATKTGVNQTVEGGFTNLSAKGYVHGAGSNTSSTAATSGVIQLITPSQVVTKGVSANSTQLSLFTTLTLHFVPEPGLLLLIGSGVVGLGLLGRSRMKK